jgi:hypothetical protein
MRLKGKAGSTFVAGQNLKAMACGGWALMLCYLALFKAGAAIAAQQAWKFAPGLDTRLCPFLCSDNVASL